MTEQDYAGLREMCAKMTRTRGHDEWLVLNTEFHDRLYSYADAPIASDLVHQLTLRVQRYVRMVRSSGRKRADDPNKEHAAILDALERNDLATARAELEKHIQHTADQVKGIFAEWSGDGDGAKSAGQKAPAEGSASARKTSAAKGSAPSSKASAARR
jgi:DNA-binding GntR family transcriptional regulator